MELESEVLSKTTKLRKLNEGLTKRNQAKDQVIAIMNHDILTPLKYLHIAARNIEEKVEEPGTKKSLHQIATTAKELEYQTSNMLNWVKLDSLEKLPKAQNVELYNVVSQLLEFTEPFKNNKQVELINNIPIGTFILTWPEQLRVLLYNIIMNSIKSTDVGSISISSNINDHIFEIIIEDTGSGMSTSMAKYLITGLSKDEVEELPKYKKGNGVGYQIIRSLIALMHAKIEITSKEMKGTKVVLYFIQF